MRCLCFQLVMQKRLQQLREAEFKHVDASVSLDEVVGELGQQFSLRHRGASQDWEGALQDGQP